MYCIWMWFLLYYPWVSNITILLVILWSVVNSLLQVGWNIHTTCWLLYIWDTKSRLGMISEKSIILLSIPFSPYYSCSMVIILFTYVVFEEGSTFIPHLLLTLVYFPKKGNSPCFHIPTLHSGGRRLLGDQHKKIWCYNVLFYHQL